MAKIIGPTNKYYISSRYSSPASTRQLMAKKGWLSSTWDLYTIKGRPMMVGCPPPTKEKIASGLSLKDVFYEMAKFETNPPTMTMKPDRYFLTWGLRKDGRLLLKQDIPSDKKRYWRNVKDKMAP